MQDVLLSMAEPNFMDIKMGLRTFAECEVETWPLPSTGVV